LDIARKRRRIFLLPKIEVEALRPGVSCLLRNNRFLVGHLTHPFFSPVVDEKGLLASPDFAGIAAINATLFRESVNGVKQEIKKHPG
jgi:hypothetical protein